MPADDEADRPRRARPVRRPPADDEDRPRRRPEPPSANGAATAALVCGILSLCTGPLVGLPAIVLGFLGVSKARSAGAPGKGMAVAGIALGAVGTLIGVAGIVAAIYVGMNAKDIAERVGGQSARGESAAKLRKVGLGTHTFHDAYAHLPNNTLRSELPGAAAPPRPWTPDQPLPAFARSWRVDLLPFVGGDAAYHLFDRTKPWDDPANRSVIDVQVEAYGSPGDGQAQPKTRFRGFVGAGTAFEPGQKMVFPGSFPDGAANTILIAEAADLVVWPEPNDIRYDAQAWPPKPTAPPVPPLFRPGRDTTLVVMADGSVRVVKKSIDPKAFQILVGRMDGLVAPEELPLAD